MTAEQDIAAIDDGGANTAAEVRTALTAVLGRADNRTVSIPIMGFRAIVGTPTDVTVASRWAGLAFDASIEELAASSWVVPADWTAIDVKIGWTQASAGTGDVVWEFNHLDVVDAETLNTPGTNEGPLTVASPGATNLDVVTLAASQAVTAGDLMLLRVIRRATSGSDTLAQDAIMVGFWMENAS